MTRNRFLLFLAGVLALKLVAVAQLWDHPLLQPDAGLDTTVYTQLAARVRAGDLALGPGLYFVSPLYIYFLAAVLGVTRSYGAALGVQALLGAAAVGCIFVAAREWFGRRAAWIAAALAALTGVFTFFESVLLQSALDPFLTAAALAALAVALHRHRDEAARWFFAAGLAFGVQALNRPNVLAPALAIAVLLVLMGRWRGALLVAVGLAVALAPAAIRNGLVAGTWSPLASHGGLNFYIGNNGEADGTYHVVDGITPDISGQAGDARSVAQQALGRTLTDAEVSAYFYRLGFDWMRAQPTAALRLFLRKIGYAFTAEHLTLNYSYPFYAYDMRTLLALLVIGAGLLVPLGAAGAVCAAPTREVGAWLIWISFVPVYAIAVALFFVSERYRLPLLIPMCVCAGGAIDWAIALRARGSHGRVAAAAAVVTAAAIAVNWPLGLDDGRTEERTRMAEQLIANGRANDAEPWIALAAADPRQGGLVEFRAGRALLQQHQADAAVRHLDRAAALDPSRPEIDYALGQALMDAGKAAEAVPHLRKAVAGGVRVDVARFDLARALALAGGRAGAVATLHTVQPHAAGDAASWMALGDLALQLEAADLAASFYERAVAAAPNAAKAHEQHALALAVAGRSREALPEFEQAVALDPNDSAAELNLAVALAGAGRVEDAKPHAEAALRLAPNYARARQFLGALTRAPRP